VTNFDSQQTTETSLIAHCVHTMEGHPAEQLLRLAEEKGLQVTDQEFAKYLDDTRDDNDELSHIRKQFHIPRVCELLEESTVVDGPAKGMYTCEAYEFSTC